jgi:hypothetical protein
MMAVIRDVNDGKVALVSGVKWAEFLKPLTTGGWFWAEDGIFRKVASGLGHETPWRHADPKIPGQTRDCKYLQLIANAIQQHPVPGTANTAVPKFCMDCYKVVMKLRGLGDVAAVEMWQQKGEASRWPCKVGADYRNYTGSHWGAYFYCRGVEEGQKRLAQVEKWRDENLPGVEVFLKRGCTEYERDIGPSSKWEYTERAEQIEAEAEQVIDPGPVFAGQPDVIASSVHARWFKWELDLSRTLNYDKYDPLSVAQRELVAAQENEVFEKDGEVFDG